MARTTTKRPAPKAKLANPRTEALARMGKPELLKTVKTLDKRVTKLLNELETARGNPHPMAGSVVIYCRDLDGTGSMHSCDKLSPGAIAFVPLSPQQYEQLQFAGVPRDEASKPPIHGAIKNRRERLGITEPSPVTKRSARDDIASMMGSAEHPRPFVGKFPWET